MQEHILFGPYETPSNVSRTHTTRESAVSTSPGVLSFSVESESGTIRNTRFDSALIKYDSSYSTVVSCSDGFVSDSFAIVTSLIEGMPNVESVLDVGCGQGDFVQALRRVGVAAHGIDPVVDSKESFLVQGLWAPGEMTADLYVFRCVLPHMEHPFEILERLWDQQPEALVYIEYQRIEWMAERQIWYQLCHDHVYQFVIDDFIDRFAVLDHGVFAEGEWQWALLGRGSVTKVTMVINEPRFQSSRQMLERMRTARSLQLQSEFLHDTCAQNLLIWGAAAKGSVLTEAIATLRTAPIVVDLEPTKHGRFLERSGVEIVAPSVLQQLTPGKTTIFVANPRHFKSVISTIPPGFRVVTSENVY